MTSHILPLHWGVTRFLNPSRDCSTFSIKDIGVKDVFGLSSWEGFNKASCFVVSSEHICLHALHSQTPGNAGTKKNTLKKLPKLCQAPIAAPIEKETFPYSFKASGSRNHRNGFPTWRERFLCNKGVLLCNFFRRWWHCNSSNAHEFLSPLATLFSSFYVVVVCRCWTIGQHHYLP